jgi:hypothetical protein
VPRESPAARHAKISRTLGASGVTIEPIALLEKELMTLTGPLRARPSMLLRAAATVVAFTLVAGCGGGSGGGGSSLQLVADGAGSASGVVGEPVAQVPGVRVVDGSGNPASGIAVSFRVEQTGASVSPATVTTGADGRARPTRWVLGTTAGANTLVASVPGGRAELSFSATAEPGPASQLQHASRQAQSGDLGMPVEFPPVVRVLDRFGNPVSGITVSFSVQEGGGAISSSSAVSGANGLAALQSWTLGDSAGLNTLAASAPGIGNLSFTAEALAPLELSIDAVQLNQGSQTGDGDIPAVAGRPGLLRVVVSANRSNTVAPDVRVRLFRDGVQLWERTISAPTAGVPVSPALNLLQRTWNIELSEEEVQPGLEVEAVVDPQQALSLPSRENTRFPRGDGQAPLVVAELPPLRVLFIQIQATRHNASGEIFPSTVESFLVPTRKWIPSGAVEGTLRGTPLVTDRDLTDDEEVRGLLEDLQLARTLASATDEYYHGIMPDISGLPVAGMAWLTTSPFSRSRSGLSYDRMPAAANTVAHELGHNLGRRHSPCGDVEDADPAFPYAGGGVGSPGYDIVDKTLQGPGGVYDYMGYCSPRWTSDYTYRNILEWRRNDPLAVGAAGNADPMAADVAEQSGLLLWGRVNDERVELHPAFHLEARAVLPDVDGPNVLRGLAADGSQLFELSFTGTAVPHARNPTEHGFSWFVPLTASQLAALDRVELSSPHGFAQQVARPEAQLGTPQAMADAMAGRPAFEPRPGGGMRLRWDPARSPVVVLRDRRTGDVMAIGRSGSLELPADVMAVAEPELMLSDGVRTGAVIPVEIQ